MFLFYFTFISLVQLLHFLDFLLEFSKRRVHLLLPELIILQKYFLYFRILQQLVLRWTVRDDRCLFLVRLFLFISSRLLLY